MSTLRKGSKGSRVGTLQRVLGSLGYRLKADDDFGPKTERAVRAFQKKHGLKVDGIVGRRTWNKLDDVYQPGEDNWTSSGVLTKARTKEAETKLPKPSSSILAHKRLKGVHPDLAAKMARLIELAAEDGLQLRVTQGVRTFAQQDALYAKGRTTKGPKVTNARGGYSKHNYGLAADVCVLDPKTGKVTWEGKYYDGLGKYAKAVGLTWGGSWSRFPDRPHFELKGLPPTRTLLATYKAAGGGQRGIKAVWDKHA